ncbi:eEF1A lysine and N-terminal methyltransferase-like protein [Drosera capensis]
MKQETGSSSSPPPSAASVTWTQAYGEAWYWDNRYNKDLSASEAVGFDCCLGYVELCMVLRFGRSFSEGMLDDGYQDIVNMDISSVVIEDMKKKYCSWPELSYFFLNHNPDIQMDVRSTNFFQTGSFDAVIDKATYICKFFHEQCGSNSMKNATMMLEEVQRYLMANYRVLKDKGVYILAIGHSEKVVSSGCSEQSKWVLNKPVPLNEDGSSVEAALGRNPNVHCIYVCTKDDLSTKNKGTEEKSEF